jgi:hypothetical protein
MLPFGLCGYEILCHVKGRTQRVCVPDRVLRTVSWSEREEMTRDLRKLRSDELHTSHPSANINFADHIIKGGPGSSVGIATDYGLDGPGIASRWVGARFSAPVQTGPGAHPASCTMGTGSFPGVKCGWGVLLTTHPLLMPRSWKSRAIPLPTLWATPAL